MKLQGVNELSVNTIENMVKWVEEHLMDSPSLEEMSNYVGYSNYYCSTKFHEYVGISFKEYVMKRRLSLAATELKKTKNKIVDIAMNYGFSSHEAFSRAFTKIYGYTPYQYRKISPEIPLYEKPSFLHTQKTP